MIIGFLSGTDYRPAKRATQTRSRRGASLHKRRNRRVATKPTGCA